MTVIIEKPAGIFLSVWTIVLAVATGVIVVVAVGLVAGFVPDRGCGVTSTDAPVWDTTQPPPATTHDPNIVWDSPRLPDTLVPLHYELKMTTDLEEFIFDGQITVTILCRKSTNVIVLNSNLLEIIEDTARMESDSGRAVVGVAVDEVNQYLAVTLDGDLDEGATYRFTVEFRGQLGDDIQGFYRSSYILPNGDRRWLAVTFFSPTNARMAFPCFDDPGLKANFTLTMVHAQNYTALGNMPLEGTPTTDPDDGLVTTRFATSPKVSTYLVCFAVLDFPHVEMTSRHGIKIRGWSRPDAIDSLGFGMNMTADTLDFYIDHIQVDFPLPKIDVVAVPDFEANAMENWGLITYRETALFNKPDTTPESSTGSQAFTIAHEMGHQYFGNLVTHEWWEYILLKEGGASYLAYTSLPVVEPTWDYQDLFIIDQVTTGMTADALPNSRPVQLYVATPEEIAASFDRGITYSKGPSILRMCESVIGKSAFKTGLMSYMRMYAFGTATNDDLWTCMQEAVDEEGTLAINVTDVMHTWVLQPGFPLVNLTRTYESTGEILFRAEQSRFLIDGEKTDRYLWMIPLTYQANSAEPTTVWMNNQPAIDHQLAGSDTDWLLVNPDRFGFYRVNYDPTNWQLLSNQLVSNHTVFSVGSRATLIDDSFTLARAGYLDYPFALEITRYLADEMDYVPWAASGVVMNYLDQRLITTPAYGSFIKYMRSQITPLYNVLGWTDGGTHLEILTRGIALSKACKYGLTDCTDQALALYTTWMDSGTNTIPIDQQNTVYCTAIAAGSVEEYEFAYNRYLTTPDAEERSALLGAMPCTELVWALNSLLEYTLDSNIIRSQDVPETIGDVAANPIGAPLAWDFFRENYDHFMETFGDSLFLFGRIIDGVTRPFNSELRLEQLEEFMADHPDQGTGASAFAQAVEQTKSNIQWMTSHYEEVRNWLDGVVTSQ